MAISSYAELQTAVINWLHRSDISTIVPDFIMLGEKRIFREVRSIEMETALSSTIASGVIAVPSDYIELKSAYINTTPTSKLIGSSVSQIYEKYPLRSSESKPKYIAREGSNFIFGPYPDSTYEVKGIYYAKLTSIDTSANALFVAHPDLYLMAALCESAPYLKDDNRITTWEAKYSSIVADINRINRDDSISAGSAMVRTA